MYIASYLTVASYTLYISTTYTVYIPWTSIATLIIKLYGVDKCHFLTRANVLTVLLEYIDLFNLSGNMKQTFGRGYPALYHSILLHFLLIIAIITKYAYVARICSYAFCSLLLPSYYSNNFVGKIDVSLHTLLLKTHRYISSIASYVVAFCSLYVHLLNKGESTFTYHLT